MKFSCILIGVAACTVASAQSIYQTLQIMPKGEKEFGVTLFTGISTFDWNPRSANFETDSSGLSPTLEIDYNINKWIGIGYWKSYDHQDVISGKGDGSSSVREGIRFQQYSVTLTPLRSHNYALGVAASRLVMGFGLVNGNSGIDVNAVWDVLAGVASMQFGDAENPDRFTIGGTYGKGTGRTTTYYRGTLPDATTYSVVGQYKLSQGLYLSGSYWVLDLPNSAAGFRITRTTVGISYKF